MYDLIIIGGGPAGVAAGIYAARKKLHTLLVTESFGGQSEVSADIQNWVGTKSISGFDLARNLEDHIRAQESITIIAGEKVYRVAQDADKIFLVSTESGVTYRARTIIMASGARRRKLGVPGEDEYNGRGVAYCSTCDAPLFAGKDVAVVGGGNAGLEAVIDLVPYALKIYLLEYGDKLKGDPITQAKVRGSANVQVLLCAETKKIFGDKDKKFVGGIEYLDAKKDTIKRLTVAGVFIEIGAVPNSEMVKGLVELNKFGEIILDHRTGATTREGMWAAGDVTDEAFKQNNISAGDGVKAALSVYSYLQKLKKEEL
jgi:alkyl hydroperoxide reductase subunit F